MWECSLLPSVSAGRGFVSREGRYSFFKVGPSKRPTSQVYPESYKQRSQENCRTSGTLSAAVCEYSHVSDANVDVCLF